MSWQVVFDIGAVVAALAVVVNGYWLRRRNNSSADNFDASAAQIIVNSARDLIPPLSKRITELEATVTQMSQSLSQAKRDVDEAEKKIVIMAKAAEDQNIFIEGLRLGVDVLVNQVREAGLTPRYTPPSKRGVTGPLGKGA